MSSSNFPRFDRNLNTGGNNYDEAKGVVAHNAVHHSKQYPSSVTVTVVRSGKVSGDDRADALGERRACSRVTPAVEIGA